MPWTQAEYVAFMQKRLKAEERTRTKIREKHETPAPVAGLPDTKRKRDTAPALDRSAQTSTSGVSGVAFRVSIISFRRKLLDGDNLIAGSKWLRDSIARKLGRDDAEGKGIEFEYAQQLTRGQQGTLVKIEQL